MTETIFLMEPAIRLGFFLGILLFIALWEVFAPRRPRSVSRWVRWPSNLGIAAINTILLRIIVPTGAIGLAIAVEENSWGLLNQLMLPGWFAILLSVLILDLAIYLQHVMFHAVPVLWRLHRMHHTDLDFDVTTGSRFHPLEIILSMGIKLVVVATLGVPAIAVLIFEILLNVTSMFNHSNVRLPLSLDQILRWFVVTPDMHRIHHSIIPREANSNFGFNLPWWDRLLGTYCAQPAHGHEEMIIGIDQFRSHRELWPDRMLVQPFHGEIGDYPINRPVKKGSGST
ncbi:MAG: sterol desaturase family protein [Gammaproteobacteria bacterium]|nr:MAG: sterol desaturase family protein [Gammaproteobacteria bacterium]